MLAFRHPLQLTKSHYFSSNTLIYLTNGRKKTQYSDVAYYYFALRYVFNIPNNSENRATNRLIGMTLINDLAEINNKYANKFIAIMKKVHKL